MRRRVVLAGLAAAVGSATPVGAQILPRSSVVVLDRDALFARSRFGRRARDDVETASNALAAENRRIEETLEGEERALTERRASMDPEDFRRLADEFDERVERIRGEQDAKTRALQQQSDRAQVVFQENVGAVLFDLAREVGASIILDRRFVIAASDQVDITDVAVERIDATLGDGSDLDPVPAPRPSLQAPEGGPQPGR